MDVADHRRLGQREEIAVVQQVLLRVLEALAADVGFRHPVGADGRAHRAVDDGDALLEDLLQRMSSAALQRAGDRALAIRDGEDERHVRHLSRGSCVARGRRQ